MPHQKSDAEFASEFQEQVSALKSSCDSYDSGNTWEHKRIASSLFILLHDGKARSRTKSLLHLMGKKDDIKFLSTVEHPVLTKDEQKERGLLAYTNTPLARKRMHGTGYEYVPKLNDSPFKNRWQWLSFSDWYHERIYGPETGDPLSRNNLIFSIRSQDGGAHVDESLTNQSYISLKHNAAPTKHVIVSYEGGRYSAKYNVGPDIRCERASMRQLGFELITTLEHHGLI